MGIVAVVGSCPISFLQIELCLTVHCSAQCSPKQCWLPGLSSTEIRIFQIIIILSPCPTPCNFIRRRRLGVDTCSHLTSLTSDKSPTSPTDLCHSVPGGSPNMVRLWGREISPGFILTKYGVIFKIAERRWKWSAAVLSVLFNYQKDYLLTSEWFVLFVYLRTWDH